MCYVGINIGALTVKVVALRGADRTARVVAHQGRPRAALDELLAEQRFDGAAIFGVSGQMGHISEVAAIQRALNETGEQVEAVASLGGESFLVYAELPARTGRAGGQAPDRSGGRHGFGAGTRRGLSRNTARLQRDLRARRWRRSFRPGCRYDLRDRRSGFEIHLPPQRCSGRLRDEQRLLCRHGLIPGRKRSKRPRPEGFGDLRHCARGDGAGSVQSHLRGIHQLGHPDRTAARTRAGRHHGRPGLRDRGQLSQARQGLAAHWEKSVPARRGRVEPRRGPCFCSKYRPSRGDPSESRDARRSGSRVTGDRTGPGCARDPEGSRSPCRAGVETGRPFYVRGLLDVLRHRPIRGGQPTVPVRRPVQPLRERVEAEVPHLSGAGPCRATGRDGVWFRNTRPGAGREFASEFRGL